MEKELEFIDSYLRRTSDSIANLDHASIINFGKKIMETIEKNKTVFFVGNGGSASTASHYVNDLLTAYTYEQSAGRPFTNKKAKAYSLTENTGVVSGLANDFNFENVFVNQLRTISEPGDLLVVISASGNSVNLLNAVKFANENGIFTVAIVGFDGGKVSQLANMVIHAKTNVGDYGPAEDVHLVINHVTTAFIRELLYGSK